MVGPDAGTISFPPVLASTDPLEPSSVELDQDFGPWLLVSHRRGPSRSHGGSARAPTAAEGSAAVPQNESQVARGPSVYSTRGGLRGGASGWWHGSHVSSHDSSCPDISVPTVGSVTVAPLVTLPDVSWDSGSRPPNEHRDSTVSSDTPFPVTSNVLLGANPSPTQLHPPYPEKNGPLISRNSSPPPVLLSSIGENPSLNPANPISDHLKLVGQVSGVLEEGSMDEDSDPDGSASEDLDDQMSEEEDEPDNLMTLDQYQEEARRVALIRKGSILDVETQKKGRLEVGEASHS